MFYGVIFVSFMMATSVCKGQTELQYANPPSGTTIGHVIGETQITITCNVTHNGDQITTRWFLSHYQNVTGRRTISNDEFSFLNISGDPRTDSLNGTLSNYGNYLTILMFSADLDGARLSCGSGGLQKLAEYPVSIYVPPSEPYNLTVIELGATWVTITWETPINRGTPEVSRYEVKAENINITTSQTMDGDNTLTLVTVSNETVLNFTGLLPNIVYTLRVTARSEVKGEVVTRGNTSETVTLTTLTINIHAIQLVLRPIQDCGTWVALSTRAKIQEITDHLQQNILSTCNCSSFTQTQIFNQTLQCYNQSPIFRAHLLEIHSHQHIDQTVAWIMSNPNITVGGSLHSLNGECPVIISSFNAPVIDCQTQLEVNNNSMGVNQTVLLIAVLGSVLGILFIVVVTCLVVVCYMCYNTNNSRVANKIEVELSAWNIQDTQVNRDDSQNAMESANDYEVVADIITNPMYKTVERGIVMEPTQAETQESDTTLQGMYDTPNAS